MPIIVFCSWHFLVRIYEHLWNSERSLLSYTSTPFFCFSKQHSQCLLCSAAMKERNLFCLLLPEVIHHPTPFTWCSSWTRSEKRPILSPAMLDWITGREAPDVVFGPDATTLAWRPGLKLETSSCHHDLSPSCYWFFRFLFGEAMEALWWVLEGWPHSLSTSLRSELTSPCLVLISLVTSVVLPKICA